MRIADFKKVPIIEAINIPTVCGDYTLVKDRWWCVTEDDCILYYRDYSRQCNNDKTICGHIMESENHPGVKSVFLENVWEKHRCRYD